MRLLWKIFLKSRGWNTDLHFPHSHLKKYILLVAPHTSNWDFIIGLAYRNLLRLNHVKFLGKRELFKPPFGAIFKRLGGIPVDRTSSHKLVEGAVKLFGRNERFAIALAPEGTRKRVEKLKTGFYFIAHRAGVPIVMVGFDYRKKTIVFSEPLVSSGDIEKDIEQVYKFYRPISGKYPEQGLMHK